MTKPKTPEEIKERLFKEITGKYSKQLLEDIIDLDPITVGNEKIKLLDTRKKWQQEV